MRVIPRCIHSMNSVIPSSERVRVCAKHGCGNLLFPPDVNLCGSCSGLDMELEYPEDTAQAFMPAFETRALEAGYYASAPNPYRQDDSWLHTNRPHVIQNYYHPSMYNARRAYTHSPMISSPLNPRPEHRMPVKRPVKGPVSTSYSFSPHTWHSPPTYRRPMDVDDRPLSLAPVVCGPLFFYESERLYYSYTALHWDATILSTLLVCASYVHQRMRRSQSIHLRLSVL